MPAELPFVLLGKNPPIDDWTKWCDPENAALDRPFAEFLAQQGLNEEAIRLGYDLAPYHGRSSRDVSTMMMSFNSGFVQNQIAAGPESFAAKGGNIKLPEAMAAQLKGDVILGKPVAAIEQNAGGVIVTCRDGSRFQAAKLVCSLPLAALRNVDITPGLPALQAKAVKEVNYQPISIAFLTAKAPFWEEDGFAPGMWSDSFSSTVIPQRYGATDEEVTGLMVQARGDLALDWDKLGAETAMAKIVADIEAMRPAAKENWRRAIITAGPEKNFQAGHGPIMALVRPRHCRMRLLIRPAQSASVASTRKMFPGASRLHWLRPNALRWKFLLDKVTGHGSHFECASSTAAVVTCICFEPDDVRSMDLAGRRRR